MTKFINFTDLTPVETRMILTWRNNPSVKRWMYNSEDILLENHLSFIEQLKFSTTKLYFLIKEDNNYIGVIDFTTIDKTKGTSHFGLYSNFALQGVGKKLLHSICEYGFKILKLNTLIAEVFVTNEKAIYLYKKFNFYEYTTNTVDNNKIIWMELKNENW